MFRVRASMDSLDGQLLSLVQHVAAGEQVTTGRAAYPEMEPKDTRLAMFSAWPTSSSIRPDTLASAGFFYTGAYFCITHFTITTMLNLKDVHGLAIYILLILYKVMFLYISFQHINSLLSSSHCRRD